MDYLALIGGFIAGATIAGAALSNRMAQLRAQLNRAAADLQETRSGVR